jgi:hypothetical protein
MRAPSFYSARACSARTDEPSEGFSLEAEPERMLTVA